jgi:arsenate reductase
VTVVLYGLKTCATVRKARAWLDEAKVAYRFHDVRAEGVTRGQVAGWAEEVGWETLLNRAGTTFRGLPDADKAGLTKARAVALMAAHPATIKRPVVEGAGPLLVGFSPERYRAAFAGRG